jgi:hypothetical protein
LIWGALAPLSCSSKPSATAGAAGASGSRAGAGGARGGSGGAGAGGAAGESADASVADAAGAGGVAGGAAGAAGATGAAGAAGAGGGGGAIGAVVPVDVGLGFSDTTASVLTRGKHETRDNFYIQPTLDAGAASRVKYDDAFVASYDAPVIGSPLYMENGPGGKGAFFVATLSNNVYAFDETTGAVLWMHNIGSAAAKSGAGCGNLMPLGIASTPVIDAATRTIFVAGVVGDATAIMRHEVHALGVDDGAEHAGWPVNVSALTAPGNVAFNTIAENQRAALSLVNKILYVPYGGHAGDCNQYRGWVIAIDTTNPTRTGAWATGGIGEGIWAHGGLASNGVGVFAITGNNMENAATHADSEEVVHVTGLAQVDRSNGIFYPSAWRTMDQNDWDFGSSNGVIFQVPGSTPSVVMAAVSKDGQFYLLDPANLGGMDGYLAKIMGVHDPADPTYYKTQPAAYPAHSGGVHVYLSFPNGVGFCPTGLGAIHSVAFTVTPGSPPTVKVAWCGLGGLGVPAVTTTDGKSNPIIWAHDGALLALHGETGQILIPGGGAKACPGVAYTQAPIVVKGRIIYAGTGGLCSYSPH